MRLSSLRLLLFTLLVPVTSVVAQTPRPEPAGTAADPAVPPLFFDVTVSAPSRTAEEASATPQSVSVTTRSEIERREARTPNQMLREEPGVWSAQVSTQGSPIIRGQIGNRILYLWDGIRLNNGALFSGPNGFFNQFPIGAVEQMEVVRGPGAVQYGSDAIGGLINVMPRTGGAFSKGLQAGGDAVLRYGSVDSEQTSFANLWLTSSRLTLTGGASGQDIGNYHVPDGREMKSSGLQATGGYVGGSLRVSEHGRLSVNWLQGRRSDIQTYTQSKLNPSGLPRIFGPFERRTVTRGDYQLARELGPVRDLRIYAYSHKYRSAGDNTTESGTAFSRTRTDTAQDMMGGGVQARSNLGRSRLVYGGDVRSEDLLASRTLFTTTKATGVTTSRIPNGSVPPGTYDVADAFALLKTEQTSHLTWTVGARAESAKLHSDPRPQDALTPFTVEDLRLDKRWTSATWSAGAVLGIAGGWSVAVNAATGFRAPTFSDTLNTGVPVFASGVASVPSPKANPEHSLTLEAGPRYQSPRVNFFATVYTNQLRDVLTSITSGTIDIPGVGVVAAQQRLNSASGYVRGLETAIAVRPLRQLTLSGNLTVTRGQDTFADVPLRFIPPANGLLSLLWESGHHGVWAEAVVLVADRLRRHAPQDELDAGFSADPGFGSPSATNPALPSFVIPGWSTTALRAGGTVWQGGHAARQRVELTLDVNNLFNTAYREAYSQQQFQAPARAAVVSLRVRY